MTHAKYAPMWTEAKAPSLAEMEAMAHEVFERLPKAFRTLCQGVIIRVDDFPTDEVMDEMQTQTEFDLLGLFVGIHEIGHHFGLSDADMEAIEADAG
jgi:predicted Zn-dependent protease with MMP-like domain